MNRKIKQLSAALFAALLIVPMAGGPGLHGLSTAVYGQISARGNASSDESATSRTLPANAPRVTARFLPDSVGIGDRLILEVDVRQDMMQVTAFPDFEDNSLGKVLEIVQEHEIDTVERDGRSFTLRKKYDLQVFEEGLLSFGHYPVFYFDKNIADTLWSADSLLLKVGTFPIDTTLMTVYDVKRPMNLSFKLGEISGYTLYAVIGLALLCALLWYIITRRRNLSLLGKPKHVDPPHVAAIKSLEILHNQKLWQNNKHKLYYTRLTDILREYIAGRYGINAMEMTSEEIISYLSTQSIHEKSFRDLCDVLRTSDLVKFAKYVPEADYNEAAYTEAYYFVEATKPDEIEPGNPQQLDA